MGGALRVSVEGILNPKVYIFESFSAFIAKMTGAASSDEDANTMAVRPAYAEGARSLVNALRATTPSDCRLGLAGIDGGPELG
ncbi:hypothetical protein ACQRIT_000187 [Beauveria bassiana]